MTEDKKIDEKSKKSESKNTENLSERERLLTELDIKIPDYPVDMDILHQIVALKRKYLENVDSKVMPYNEPEYLDLMVRFMRAHNLSIIHPTLPIGFPTELENVKYAYHFSFPVQAQIVLQNGFRKYFMFKKNVIALLVDPPVYTDVKNRNKHANEGDFFAQWTRWKEKDCPNVAKLQRMCADFDITLLMDVYSESLADAVEKSSKFEPYLEI